MKCGMFFKIFTCFVCSFSLIFMGGFSSIRAENRGGTSPIGEMISRGQVMFQTPEKVWKKVESSSFPIFQGMNIKTEKGRAAISLGDQNQIEVGPNSILAFERQDKIRLSKGNIDFRIAPQKGLSLCAGNLIVVGTAVLHAEKSPASPSRSEEALGSLKVLPNGAVTIHGNRGHLTLLNQERAVLAAISPKESITVPAAIAANNLKGEKPPVQIAQVGEEEEPAVTKGVKEPAGPAEPQKSAGLSGTTWVIIGLGVLAAGGVAALAGGGGGGGGESSSPPPVCP
ncbi:MAG: hypothetical protein H6Q43_1526 [Deltaproteobacteria bacterium]|nr:hypothetical protein [Deltaproteobacteria bacterium]